MNEWERREIRTSQLVLLRCCHIIAMCAFNTATLRGEKLRSSVVVCAAYVRSWGRSRQRPRPQSLLRSICRLSWCLLYAFIHISTLYHSHSFPTVSLLFTNNFIIIFTNILCYLSWCIYTNRKTFTWYNHYLLRMLTILSWFSCLPIISVIGYNYYIHI